MEIWNLFYAIHVSEIISLEDNKRLNIRPEPFFMIDLPIPTNLKNSKRKSAHSTWK